ncbi:voltage-gated chloride channel ClcB [Pusillimonas caeni]|uniref:ClcB-like voltage-gated chloride channel protein n=1 Tax=Pusillimonas caeni TaxID=1348472 RepID=UPI000E59C746|nr:ClcB-like voltage-gated chloride channel protein [Pusillimonas caeni]TFL13095.1 voltage-gated chloride channel ClcB [Pusillimonas caeni]
MNLPSVDSLSSRLKDYAWLSDLPAMLFWAALVGVLAALATLAFYQGMYFILSLVGGQSGSVVQTMQGLPWYGRLLLPAAGGVVAGCLLHWSEKHGSRATSDYMEAVAIGDGRLSISQGLLRSLSSLFTVVSGGSIGREGAMVHLGAMGASIVGRLARLDTTRLRLLVACGAAAGVSAAYGAPIAGALFVAEIVLGAMAIQSVGPLLISAAFANLTMRATGHYHIVYPIEGLSQADGVQILPFVVLGLLSGVLAPQFLRFLGLARGMFEQTGFSLPVRLGFGGLLVGLLLISFPYVAGNGFSVVTSLLHHSWTWQALLSVLLLKVVATAFTVGSGAVGGVFTPALLVGAAFGAFFGHIVLFIWPEADVSLYLFTLVGMGAFLGAATGAPLMAIVMIFEMTVSYQLVLPLMVACVLAYFVSRAVAQVAMYDVTLTRERDLVLRRGLRHLRLSELVRPAQTVISTDTPVKEALQMFMEYPVKYLYVVDEDNVYQGVVAQRDLTSLLMTHTDVQSRVAGDVVRYDFLKPLHPDMGLDEAQAVFVQFQGERLPVVSRDERPKLLGVVYKSALLEKYSALKRSLDASAEVLAEVTHRRR